MKRVTAAIDIDAPPEKVWEIVMDPERLKDWVTIHRKLGPASKAPLENGSTLEQTLHLRDGGMDVSVSASQLEEGQSPNLLDVRVDAGGVSTDYGLANFGSASASAADKRILHVTQSCDD